MTGRPVVRTNAAYRYYQPGNYYCELHTDRRDLEVQLMITVRELGPLVRYPDLSDMPCPDLAQRCAVEGLRAAVST